MANAFTTIICGYFSLTLYKITSLLVGFALAYMGYRLFMAGIWGNAGDLEAKYGNQKLVIKAAAPGTFFAILGTLVLAVTIWKGLELAGIEAMTNKTNPVVDIEKEIDDLKNLKHEFSN